MIVCLSPNGRNQSRSDGPATTLLVATIDGILTLSREQAGHPWTVTRRSLEGKHISSILFEPESGMIFAGVHGSGLYASSDGGATWEDRSGGLYSPHVFTLAVQQRDGKAVLYAGTEPAALHRSFDLGVTWEEMPSLRNVPGTDQWTFPPARHIAHVKNLAFDLRDPATFYACVEQGALLKTTDDGATWTEIASFEDSADMFRHDCHRLVLGRSNPDNLYLAMGEGVFISHDAGATWEHPMTREGRLGYPDGLFIDPHDENTLYISGGERAPGTWRNSRSNATVMRSRDGGRSWEEIAGGLPQPMVGNIEAISLHEWGDNAAFYIGTATGELYESEDRGETWRLITDDLQPVSKVGHYKMFVRDEQSAVGVG